MFTAPPTRDDLLAAIDIGTNNCRLLIARLVPDPAGGLKPEIVDAFSRLVRLGEGLSAATQLTEAAMARTLEALVVCVAKMHRRGVTRYRAVATESCRRAGNAPDFVARVLAATELQLDVIDAAEEARLALQGCAPLFEPDRFSHGLHFDIGGGSTELAWATLAPEVRLEAQVSIPCGVTGLTEINGADRLTANQYRGIVAEVTGHLRPFADQIAPQVAAARAIQYLGCAGTISTIAALVQDLPFYQRARVDGYQLDMAQARQAFRQLQALDFRGRSAIPSLGVERADLILAGCAIVEAIADTWGAQTMRVADRGIREGILYDLIGLGRIAS